MMKRIALLLAVGAVFLAPAVKAQDHVEVGAFIDYFRLHETGSNFVGVGGRAAFGIVPHVQLEAEMAYDFSRAFTETFNNGTGTISTQNSNLKVLHGLFGPKIQSGGPVRVFVTLKGGFVDFRFDPRNASFANFVGSVDALRTDNLDGVLYPGGGLEAYLGPIGLRLDVGDEIIFVNGAQHNWKVTFGPVIHF
jgi:hypothetical protein